MYYHSKILAIGMIAGALSPGLSAQQTDSLGWKTIEQVRYSDAWLSSENAAGLYALPSVRLSVVEGYAGKEKGGFVNYGGSDNSTRFGAGAESFYRQPRSLLLRQAQLLQLHRQEYGRLLPCCPVRCPL